MEELKNEVKIFEGHEVEVLEFEGQVLFNPYHVGKCLEISADGVRKAITRMSEKQVIKLTNSKVANCHFRKLHNTGENFLTESGVYKLVFKSHKPNAEKFTDWIADEVLPSIRKISMRYLEKMGGNQVELREINEKQEQTITTLEVAEMLGVRHDNVMRKLEGRNEKGKCIKGYVEILTDHQMEVTDYFIPSTYQDVSGKINRCYKVTKLGCDFLANKFTGEKGVLFTAKYVKRFHEMEDTIKGKEELQLEAITKQVINQVMERLQMEGMSNRGNLEKGTESRLPKAKPQITKLEERAIPVSMNWYERNKSRIYRACVEYEIKHSDIYHDILKKCGEKYDLRVANEIYRQEVGNYPKYAIDIVNYFPELAEIADKFLDSIR